MNSQEVSYNFNLFQTEEYLNISTQVLAREELNYQLENVEEHRER